MPADLPTLQRSPMPRQRLSSTEFMERQPRLSGFPGSFRLNACFPNDHAVFLMFPDNQFAKLFAVAEIDIQTQRRHALLDLGKLGGLTNGLTDARDDFRRHVGWSGDSHQMLTANPGTALSATVGACGSIGIR